MAISFTHYAFPTRNMEAVRRFYCDLCGMRAVKDRKDATTGQRVLWLAPENADLPLFVVIETADDESAGRPEPFSRHLGFEVESRRAVDARAETFRKAGYAVAGPEYVNAIVGYIFMVHDPDGRVVEFSTEQDVSPANWDPEAR